MERYFNLFLFALLLAFGTVSMGCGPDDTGNPEGDADTDADADTDTDTDTYEVDATLVITKSLSFMDVFVDGDKATDCTDDECTYDVDLSGIYTVTADCDECLFLEYDVTVTDDIDYETSYSAAGAGGLAPNGVYSMESGAETTVETRFYADAIRIDGLNVQGIMIAGNKISLNTNPDRDDCYIFGSISDDLRTISYTSIWEGEETNSRTYTLVSGAVRSTEE